MNTIEYIERAVAIERARNELDLINKSHWSADEIVDFLKRLPAADVVEVRHGRWVHGREVGREYLGDCLVGIFYDRWTCSECGYVVDDHEYSRINYKFCPNCGAKMDGGGE